MKRQQIIESLFETMDIAKRSMHGHMQIVIGDNAISRTQLELLFTIKHVSPANAKQLAQTLHLTPGAISQLVEELDKQGFIERQTDPNDRRRQALHVSSQGLELLKAIEKRRRSVMEHVIQDLSDEELLTWLKIQQKIISEFQLIHQQDNERRKV